MINTPKLIKLAKEAGYGTQITLFMDGQREDIWGGAMETNKMEKFAELIVKECMFQLVHESLQESNEIQDFTVKVWNRVKEQFGVE